MSIPRYFGAVSALAFAIHLLATVTPMADSWQARGLQWLGMACLMIGVWLIGAKPKGACAVCGGSGEIPYNNDGLGCPWRDCPACKGKK